LSARACGFWRSQVAIYRSAHAAGGTIGAGGLDLSLDRVTPPQLHRLSALAALPDAPTNFD
jgi:hypothetical protein